MISSKVSPLTGIIPAISTGSSLLGEPADGTTVILDVREGAFRLRCASRCCRSSWEYCALKKLFMVLASVQVLCLNRGYIKMAERNHERASRSVVTVSGIMGDEDTRCPLDVVLIRLARLGPLAQ